MSKVCWDAIAYIYCIPYHIYIVYTHFISPASSPLTSHPVLPTVSAFPISIKGGAAAIAAIAGDYSAENNLNVKVRVAN